MSQPKSIKKIAHTCKFCKKLLSLSELAFNEDVCDKCQADANAIFRGYVEPFLKNLNHIK